MGTPSLKNSKLADGQVIPLLNDGFLVVGSVSEVVVAQVQSGQFAQAFGSQVAADGTALPVGILILLAFQAGDEKIIVRRRRGQQRMRWLDGFIDSMDMGLCEPRVHRELVMDREAWHALVHGAAKSRT